MSAASYCVFVLSCALLCVAQGQEFVDPHLWPCVPVIPQRNATIEQILGTWSVASVSSYSRVGKGSLETTFNLSRLNDTIVRLTIDNITTSDYYIQYLHGPWLVVLPGSNSSLIVTHISQDNSVFIVANCNPFRRRPLFAVLSRHLPLSDDTWNDINESIGASGLQIPPSDYYWISTYTSPQ